MTDEDEKKTQQERADAIRKQIEDLKKQGGTTPAKTPRTPREFVEGLTRNRPTDGQTGEKTDDQ